MGEVFYDADEYQLAKNQEYALPLPEALPQNATVTALVASFIAFSGACRLHGAQVYSNKASPQFIQIFDAIATPASGAVPVFVATVGATANLGLYWGASGRWFDRGIVFANSSTAATNTIGSADCWFDVQITPQVI